MPVGFAEFRTVGSRPRSGISSKFVAMVLAVGAACLRPLCLVALLVLASGCNPNDPLRSYAGAVGPDLYSKQTSRNTTLLNLYMSNICAQAGLYTDSSDSCILSTPADWKTFVDMGLYDIDQRCDTFLDGLYYKDKSTEPILAQISNTRTFTRAVLNETASSRLAIAIVAAAFDLTEATFRNSRTSLLDALDPTTVKSIVFHRQQIVKREIYRGTIASKPQALHALRTYLRVCMPFTIEMEANAVLTTVQRTGEVGESPISFDAVKFRESLKSTPGTRADEGSGVNPGGGVNGGPDDGTESANDLSKFEKDTSPAVHRSFAQAICVSGIAPSTKDFGAEGSTTRQAIKSWETGLIGFLPAGVSANGIIDSAVEDRYMREMATSKDHYRCGLRNSLVKTAYEAAVFLTVGERQKWQKRILDYLEEIEDSPEGGACGAKAAGDAFKSVLDVPANIGAFGPESRKALAAAKVCLLTFTPSLTITSNDEFEPALDLQ